MRMIIPALEAVVKAARKHRHYDPVLRTALEELDVTYADLEYRTQERLKAEGVDCEVCGRRFLPRPGDWTIACSIGCRLKY